MKAVLDYSHPALPAESLRFASPRIVLRAEALAEVVPLIERVDAETRGGRWAVGFVAYEAAPAFDLSLPVRAADAGLPLAQFAIYDAPDESGASDAASGEFRAGPVAGGAGRADFSSCIESIRAGIADGDYYQVNLTARHNFQFSGAAAALYAALRSAQPESFGLFIESGDFSIASVSPELFFDRRAGRLHVRPMKGTAPRLADPAADAMARESLRLSDKERAENLMIVDLLRNDLSRVAATGSVRVPRLFEIEALPTAWQMTSTVECTERAEVTLAEVFAALFPCGSVTGAPKRAAMAAIAGLEGTPRGVYCGALGVVRPGGHATFAVAIRTVVVQDGTASCGIGSGITLDSSAEGEWAEWAVKRRFLWRASAPFDVFETLRLENGVVCRAEAHLARLIGSARHFGFPVAPSATRAALDELAARHPAGVFRARLRAGRDGAVAAEAVPLDPTPKLVRFALADSPVDEDAALPHDLLAHKTTWRSHYPAPPDGAFDVLLFNRAGFVTEFTRGNIVYEWLGRRYTPPADGTLLPGVLRGQLLAKGEISERPLRLDELPTCAHLWFVNSLRGEIPARRLA